MAGFYDPITGVYTEVDEQTGAPIEQAAVPPPEAAAAPAAAPAGSRPADAYETGPAPAVPEPVPGQPAGSTPPVNYEAQPGGVPVDPTYDYTPEMVSEPAPAPVSPSSSGDPYAYGAPWQAPSGQSIGMGGPQSQATFGAVPEPTRDVGPLKPLPTGTVQQQLLNGENGIKQQSGYTSPPLSPMDVVTRAMGNDPQLGYTSEPPPPGMTPQKTASLPDYWTRGPNQALNERAAEQTSEYQMLMKESEMARNSGMTMPEFEQARQMGEAVAMSTGGIKDVTSLPNTASRSIFGGTERIKSVVDDILAGGVKGSLKDADEAAEALALKNASETNSPSQLGLVGIEDIVDTPAAKSQTPIGRNTAGRTKEKAPSRPTEIQQELLPTPGEAEAGAAYFTPHVAEPSSRSAEDLSESLLEGKGSIYGGPDLGAPGARSVPAEDLISVPDDLPVMTPAAGNRAGITLRDVVPEPSAGGTSPPSRMIEGETRFPLEAGSTPASKMIEGTSPIPEPAPTAPLPKTPGGVPEPTTQGTAVPKKPSGVVDQQGRGAGRTVPQPEANIPVYERPYSSLKTPAEKREWLRVNKEVDVLDTEAAAYERNRAGQTQAQRDAEIAESAKQVSPANRSKMTEGTTDITPEQQAIFDLVGGNVTPEMQKVIDAYGGRSGAKGSLTAAPPPKAPRGSNLLQLAPDTRQPANWKRRIGWGAAAAATGLGFPVAIRKQQIDNPPGSASADAEDLDEQVTDRQRQTQDVTLGPNFPLKTKGDVTTSDLAIANQMQRRLRGTGSDEVPAPAIPNRFNNLNAEDVVRGGGDVIDALARGDISLDSPENQQVLDDVNRAGAWLTNPSPSGSEPFAPNDPVRSWLENALDRARETTGTKPPNFENSGMRAAPAGMPAATGGNGGKPVAQPGTTTTQPGSADRDKPGAVTRGEDFGQDWHGVYVETNADGSQDIVMPDGSRTAVDLNTTPEERMVVLKGKIAEAGGSTVPTVNEVVTQQGTGSVAANTIPGGTGGVGTSGAPYVTNSGAPTVDQVLSGNYGGGNYGGSSGGYRRSSSGGYSRSGYSSKKKKGKKGSMFGEGFPFDRQDSPMRQQILATIQASMNKGKSKSKGKR